MNYQGGVPSETVVRVKLEYLSTTLVRVSVDENVSFAEFFVQLQRSRVLRVFFPYSATTPSYNNALYDGIDTKDHAHCQYSSLE